MPSIAVERKIPASGVRSLVWEDDTLVDWAGGGRRFALDGTDTAPRVYFAFDFDSAVLSPSGEFAALISRLGTKALLLRHGEVIRQLNRDFYHASTYPYPLTFARLPEGREVVIHCPESYCQLEIEDIVTGERIPSSTARTPADFFQSGLDVSPGGRWLLSAGWVWHPVLVAGFYDLSEAILDSSALDQAKMSPPGAWEVGSATFIDDDTVLVGTTDEFFGNEGDAVEDRPGKQSVARWRIGHDSYERAIRLDHPPGTLMPLGTDFVVTFYDHPRLYDLRSGALLGEWQVCSGRQVGSITSKDLPPPIALQPGRGRFAVATSSEIHVVEIDISALPG